MFCELNYLILLFVSGVGWLVCVVVDELVEVLGAFFLDFFSELFVVFIAEVVEPEVSVGWFVAVFVVAGFVVW